MKKNMQLARLLNEIHEQWARDNGYRKNPQATSSQASSGKLQARRHKRQASSRKLQAP